MARITRRRRDRRKRTAQPYVQAWQDFIVFRHSRNPFRTGTADAAEYARGWTDAENGDPFRPDESRPLLTGGPK